MKEERFRARKNLAAALVLGGLVLSAAGCNLLNNIPKITQPAPMSVAGNWQFDLMDNSGNVGSVATGFLQQSSGKLTGAFDLGSCGSNANASGTVGGNNGINAISLSINLNNQTLNIVGNGVGTITAGSAIQGNYTVGAITCPISGLTSTVSGQQINPISGSFHGSLRSTSGSTFNISGTGSQGQSSSGPTAPLSGTATVTGSTCFNNVNLSGTIGGTAVNLGVASSDGSQTAQLTAAAQNAAGQFTSSPGMFTITQLSGNYTVSTGSCSGDKGTFSISFP